MRYRTATRIDANPSSSSDLCVTRRGYVLPTSLAIIPAISRPTSPPIDELLPQIRQHLQHLGAMASPERTALPEATKRMVKTSDSAVSLQKDLSKPHCLPSKGMEEAASGEFTVEMATIEELNKQALHHVCISRILIVIGLLIQHISKLHMPPIMGPRPFLRCLRPHNMPVRTPTPHRMPVPIADCSRSRLSECRALFTVGPSMPHFSCAKLFPL